VIPRFPEPTKGIPLNSEQIFRVSDIIWHQIFNQLDTLTDTDTAAKAAQRAANEIESALLAKYNVPRYEKPKR
jgi:hypothetical protein